MDTVLGEQNLNASVRNEARPSQAKWKSGSDMVLDSDDKQASGFDCNICLDSVQDPVVTLCGHLYCWPCIYKWLQYKSKSVENEDQQPQPQLQCPVCKAEVSQETLVPLFGRDQNKKRSKSKALNLGIIIPRRPLSLACGIESPRSPMATSSPRIMQQVHHRDYNLQRSVLSNNSLYPATPASRMLSPGGPTANLFDPVIAMVAEIFCTSILGNSMTSGYTYPNSYHMAGSASPRVRRHIMQADKSLNRICIFLFCCMILCLLSF